MLAAVTLAPNDLMETLLTVSGTGLLVAGHLLNWQALRRARNQ